ncbi:MAG: chorismate mutase [Spirochaetia bacterium]
MFELQIIAQKLESLEETILHKLFDRAQFGLNPPAYQPEMSGFPKHNDMSLLEIRLRMQEEIDARFGRYTVPEEQPFHNDLPAPQREGAFDQWQLPNMDFSVISQCNSIMKDYLELLPEICRHLDDGHYGSAVEHDVFSLQAIARRIHYGAIYVAESKYQADPKCFRTLIQKKDTDALMQTITREEVEERILRRVKEKTTQLQAQVNKNIRNCVNPDRAALFYKETVIPLTKQGEIQYLLHR